MIEHFLENLRKCRISMIGGKTLYIDFLFKPINIYTFFLILLYFFEEEIVLNWFYTQSVANNDINLL